MFWKTPAVKAILLVIIVIIVVASGVLLAFSEEIIIKRQPVQNMHAEITGKRTIKQYGSASQGAAERRIPKCIVAFKLSDGSEKELRIEYELFNKLQEGDTGVLSFQENKNMDKWKEESKWAHRHFVSFEKDEP